MNVVFPFHYSATSVTISMTLFFHRHHLYQMYGHKIYMCGCFAMDEMTMCSYSDIIHRELSLAYAAPLSFRQCFTFSWWLFLWPAASLFWFTLLALIIVDFSFCRQQFSVKTFTRRTDTPKSLPPWLRKRKSGKETLGRVTRMNSQNTLSYCTLAVS